MLVRDIAPSEVEAARRFLVDNGWAHRVGSPEQFAQLIHESQRTAVAFEGPEVVGFARGITDGQSNGYLSMVAVAPAHRRKGLGTALVSHVTSGPASVTWFLQAGREGAAEFFSRLGFRPAPLAMQRARAQAWPPGPTRRPRSKRKPTVRRRRTRRDA
jgi:ribosomal protein S18 acetylase RimI-like enzyme